MLSLTFRFIQPLPLYHGSGDGGGPEWPPSPMRAFQALVNATSLRHRGKPLPSDVEAALLVLEGTRPHIVAPRARPAQTGYRAYVPHNQADLVSAAWHRGNIEASIATHRIEKDIRPMRIHQSGEDAPELHYRYKLDVSIEESQRLLSAIRPCARSISSLGWGIDVVAADATLHFDDADPAADQHPEDQRWQPHRYGKTYLRVHRVGSLQALRQQHESFLRRLVDGKFNPVPQCTARDIVPYANDDDPMSRPYTIFKLLDPNEDPARYPHAKLIHIAGMVRHLAIDAMRRSPPPWISDEDRDDFVCRVIRGKRDDSSEKPHQQISYIPLPSIGHEHADGIIRNVMLVAPLGMDRELDYLVRQIDGESLQPEADFEECRSDASPIDAYRAELRSFTPPKGKFIDAHYLGLSSVWQSVTPVILDGHDDKKANKTSKLIQLALERAGMETPCKFTWQSFPHYKNCLSAHKYDRDGRHTGYHRPAHLKKQTAIHVRLTFEHPVPGPMAIGAGRHCGFGTMAAEGP